jgi:alpha-glutamyl/putrescinyl thymine pyrophosphorylase clade 1
MNKAPIPRPGVYELYWQFAYNRQRAFEARAAGVDGPWSDDPIIQQYKFCNVFRATDRVSQYLIRHVCYGQPGDDAVDRLFQIVAFRVFSNIQTWELVLSHLGQAPTIDTLIDGSFERALDAVKSQTGKLYTGAFILCATDAYGRRIKHLNHVELFKDMFVNRNLGQSILNAPSLKHVYDLIHSFPLMGDFMSYQIAIDINYSDLINFSENEFTKAGPGALRGIKKVFIDTNGLSAEQVIMWMVEHQHEEFSRLGYTFNGLFGRSLHAIDAQGLFCETDKYCREAVPDLKSARTRIKAKFNYNPQPFELFFPPKWELDTQTLIKLN